MTSFTCSIITPDRQVFSDRIESVAVPTSKGTITVLAHHTPLFTALSEGEVKILSGKREYYLAIGGGFMEVTENGVSVLVSRAYNADELNETEIKKAQTAAKEALTKQVKGIERTQALAMLHRSIVEMKVIRRHKNRPLPRNI